ncbi:hypothetical protein HPB50_025374 [Hyalomma asiaticum]|uniref:Uncharacterized protein n=1 Tax=Hyalomma asiaticum TaxID=266040 RepID=A0ACB7S677_HYAAI|nr:hypothetical protein HPB50_025374 [Hyalomma asiaticum]
MAEAGPPAPDLETQRSEITNLFKKALKKDDLWYMVDKRWFNQWKRYVGYDSWETSNDIGEQTTHPGPIDNSPLLKEDNSGETKDHLIDDLDFLLLPQEAWEKMVSWYGLMPGQSPLPRKVIEIGLFVKNCKVEVYPVEFKLCTNSNMDQFVTKRFSKVDTIAQVEKDMRAIFKVPPEKETRLWSRCSSNTYEHLPDRSRTIQDIGLYPGQILLLEERNDDGSWPRQVKSSKSPYSNSRGSEHKSYGAPGNTIATRSYSAVSSSYSSYSGSYNYDLQGGNTPGLCGLGNIGNTCFMNAALQCMSNTPPLTEYFMTDRYLSELNDSNPLGMRGEIAKSYADLIKVMWSGNCSSVIPRPFKVMWPAGALALFSHASDICGTILKTVLTGVCKATVHDIGTKPKRRKQIALVPNQAAPLSVVAQEAWQNYLMRNNSIIVDIFHGLLKSTLVCPDCHKLSVTFDPFCYLSLPLPYKKEKPLELILVRADPHEKPIKLKVTVSKMSTIQDVCNSISRLMDIPADRLVVTEVHNHRFLKVLTHADQVDTLERSDVFVYEMPQSADNSTLFLPVYMREKSSQCATNSRAAPGCHLFSYPFFVSVPAKDCTYDMLYERILNCLVRYVTPPKPGDEWCGSESMEEQNGELHNGQDELFADADEEMPSETAPEPPPKECLNKKRRLFTLHCINENSSLNLASLVDNGQPLKLAPRTYIGADWLPKVRAQYFDEAKADDVLIHESVHQRAMKRQLQLRECLELFTTTEKLGAEDPWFCPTCRSHKQATKKFDLWSLPRVLIIHLKRFSYNRFWRDKIDTHVDFPITDLCMDDYIINRKHERAVYDLIAVANHYGSMGGGHYTAYAKNKETQKWYHFDDSSVSSAAEDNVVSKAAYVLFYIRRDSPDRTSPKKRSTAAAAATTRQSCSTAVDEERMDLS